MLGGRYQKLRTIGRGGMGEVFLAEDRVLGRQVAIKQLIQSPAGEDRAVATERLLREARSAARIHHRNVVTVHDLLVDGEDAYIVMEYVPAENLAQLLRRGPMPVERMQWIGSQVADALGAAHRLGIVHRDVKPSNILIGSDGVAKLTDFGVARVAGDAGLTQAGHMIGSVAYMAPEVARGFEAGPAADIFSLGATLFTALEGHAPFANGDETSTSVAILVRLVTEKAPRASQAGPMADLIAQMLDADATLRPDAEEVSRQLGALDSAQERMERPFPPRSQEVPPQAEEPPTVISFAGGSEPLVTRIRAWRPEVEPAPSTAEPASSGVDAVRASQSTVLIQATPFAHGLQPSALEPDGHLDPEQTQRRPDDESATNEDPSSPLSPSIGTDVVGGPVAGAPGRRSRPGRWSTPRRLVVVAAGIGLAGALITTGVVLGNEGSSGREARDSAIFEGTYEYRAVVIRSNNPAAARVGEETTYTWQVSTNCAADSCQIKALADGAQISIQKVASGLHSEQNWQKDCPETGTYEGLTVRDLAVDSVMNGRMSKLSGLSEKKQLSLCRGQSGPLPDVTYQVTATLISK